MTQNEIRKAINEYINLYPNTYKNYDQFQLERVVQSWGRLYADVDNYEVFVEALYEYNRNSSYPTPPTSRMWLDYYRKLLVDTDVKSGKRYRRIETPEEVMYQIYLNEMKKPRAKRNEWLVEQALPYAKLFNDEEAYIRYFGKSREEFEKL